MLEWFGREWISMEYVWTVYGPASITSYTDDHEVETKLTSRCFGKFEIIEMF